MIESSRLSRAAKLGLDGASTIFVSPISFYEISQKARLGKWPAISPLIEELPNLLVHQGAKAARLEPEICLRAGLMDWAHRDPFDRLLAATALHFKLSIVSADSAFDGIVARVW